MNLNTYADYCTWDDNKRWELIAGVPYAMSPAPSPKHQNASVKLSWLLQDSLHGKPCKLFTASFDVRLNASDEDDTVVQPDLLVICERSKIDDKGCKGAPDLVVEILSSSTARHDRLVKYNLYKACGVREYWIIDPDTKTVSVNVLQGVDYISRAYGDTNTAPVTIPLGLTYFRDENANNYGAVMAASVCSLVPIFMVFLAFQKQFVAGIATSGMKE